MNVRMKEWVHPRTGEVRRYFNKWDVMELIGLELTYYKTGNISTATLRGEPISNASARRYLDAIQGSYVDSDGLHVASRVDEGTVVREALEEL